MPYLLLLPLLYVTLVVDREMVAVWAVAGVTPHLTALVLVSGALARCRVRGATWGATVGLAADVAGTGTMGLGILCGAVVGSLLQRGGANSWAQWWPVRVAATALAVTVWIGCQAMLGTLVVGRPGVMLACWLPALGIGLYTAAVSIPWWLAVHWWTTPSSQPRAAAQHLAVRPL